MACHECGRSLRELDVAKLTDPRDGHAYCMQCWSSLQSGDEESDAELPRWVCDPESASEKARNDANKRKLREWFPPYCTHHLYNVHVRNHPSRACTGGKDGGPCKFSHDVPQGLAMKARELDLA